MISVKINATGVKTVRNRFRIMTKRAPVGAQKAVEKLGVDMLDEVRRQYFLAGLHVVTGEYLRGIHIPEIRLGRDSASVVVVSSSPQGPRLEYGFMGVDAIGRHYAQPPRPHWRPAMMIVGQRAPRAVYGAVIEELKIK